MKISKSQLEDIIRELFKEEEEYKKFYEVMLKKYGVNEIDNFPSDDVKSKFLAEVDKKWKSICEKIKTRKKIKTEAAQRIKQFDNVHILPANLSGIVYKIQGDNVVVNTLKKGLVKTKLKYLKVMPGKDESVDTIAKESAHERVVVSKRNPESVNEAELPKDGSTIKVGNTRVEIKYVGKNKDYVGFNWKGDDGKSNYEETKVSYHKDMNSLINTIKGEIRHQRVVVSKRKNESVNEGSIYSSQNWIQKLTPKIEKEIESLKKGFPQYDIKLVKNRYERDGSYTLSVSGKNTSTNNNNKLERAITAKIKESVDTIAKESIFGGKPTTMNNLDWGNSTAERTSNINKYNSLKSDKEKDGFLQKLKGKNAKKLSSKKVDAKVIADRMRKHKEIKFFADKIEKLKMVSAEDLNKILPDYVAGSTITQLFNESVKKIKSTHAAVVTEATKFYAFFGGKKHEIEGTSLWDAKQKAITKLKVPKSKVGLLAIVNASDHDKGSFKFD